MKKSWLDIKNWLSDYQNLILIAILIFALGIRLYYYPLTSSQGLWWDEAEYLVTSYRWAGLYDWWTPLPLRPPLLPIIMTLLAHLGLEETGTRALIFIMSLASIYLIYLVGKVFYNKKVGLVSASFLAIFWSFLFFSFRILTDVPVAMLWLSTIYLFFSAYYGKEEKWRYILGGVSLGLAFLMKFSTFALIGAIIIYLVVTERTNLLKWKKSTKNILLFFLASLIVVSPFLIWQQLTFGNPLAFVVDALDGGETPHTFWESLRDQTLFSMQVLHPAIILSFLAGAIFIVGGIILGYDLSLKKGSNTNKSLFVIIWLLVALLFFGKLNYGSYMEERYYFIFDPAILIIAGTFIVLIYNYVRKYNKIFALLVIAALFALAAYQNLSHADTIIKNKAESFKQIRPAGLWVRENSSPQDFILVTDESASYFYFSQRYLEQVVNKTHLQEAIERENPKYLVMSLYYAGNLNSQEFIDMANYVFNDQQNFTLVQRFEPYIDSESRIPIVSVFRINY